MAGNKLVWRDVMAQSIPDNSSQNILAANSMLQDALTGLGASIGTFTENKQKRDRDLAASGALEALSKYKDSNDAHDALVSGAIFNNIDQSKLSYDDRLNLLKNIGDIGDLNRGEQTKGLNDQSMTLNTQQMGINNQTMRSNDLRYQEDLYNFGRTRNEDSYSDEQARRMGFNSYEQAEEFYNLQSSQNTLTRDDSNTQVSINEDRNKIKVLNDAWNTDRAKDAYVYEASGRTIPEIEGSISGKNIMTKMAMENAKVDISKMDNFSDIIDYIGNSELKNDKDFLDWISSTVPGITPEIINSAIGVENNLPVITQSYAELDRMNAISKAALYDMESTINVGNSLVNPEKMLELGKNSEITKVQAIDELLSLENFDYSKDYLDSAMDKLMTEGGLNAAQAAHFISNNTTHDWTAWHGSVANKDAINSFISANRDGFMSNVYSSNEILKTNNEKINREVEKYKELLGKRSEVLNRRNLSEEDKQKRLNGIDKKLSESEKRFEDLTISQSIAKKNIREVYNPLKNKSTPEINKEYQSDMRKLRDATPEEQVEWLKQLRVKEEELKRRSEL